MPATTLMGATLPAVARWVKRTPEGFSQLGIFYAANIFGAVVGALAAGFVLLPQTDLMITSYVAAAINVLVGVSAVRCWCRSAYSPPDVSPVDDVDSCDAPAMVLAVIGLSGFAALSAEVIWTRLLALLFGPTAYTFTIILRFFRRAWGLAALAARWVRRSERPLRWLAVAQLDRCLPCALCQLHDHSRRALLAAAERSRTARHRMGFPQRHIADGRRPASVGCAMGCEFSARTGCSRNGSTGLWAIGRANCAANTLGAIVGSLLTIAVLIPGVGSQHAQQLLAIASGIAAALALARISASQVSGARSTLRAAGWRRWPLPSLPRCWLSFRPAAC